MCVCVCVCGVCVCVCVVREREREREREERERDEREREREGIILVPIIRVNHFNVCAAILQRISISNVLFCLIILVVLTLPLRCCTLLGCKSFILVDFGGLLFTCDTHVFLCNKGVVGRT